MGITSYAQNFEDVMLARAFPGPAGFYVDVGANDPDIDSVTRAFYERGWRGINIEPIGFNFERLVERRPRDINLRIAAGETEGSMTFYEVDPWHGFSTTDPALADQHRRDGLKVVEHPVPTRRLAAVLDEHAAGQTIDFLSVDVEGAELLVLRGAELDRHRPKIIVLESRMPVPVSMADRPDDVPDRADEYAAFLKPYGYRPVYHDGLNAFFVADEHGALERWFQRPPGTFDQIKHAASMRPLEQQIVALTTELEALRREVTRLRQKS